MSDDEIRLLERAARTGDPGALLRLEAHRDRTGSVDEAELAAFDKRVRLLRARSARIGLFMVVGRAERGVDAPRFVNRRAVEERRHDLGGGDAILPEGLARFQRAPDRQAVKFRQGRVRDWVFDSSATGGARTVRATVRTVREWLRRAGTIEALRRG